MSVSLLNFYDQKISDYPAEKVDLLVDEPFSKQAKIELDRLHRGRYRLRCGCRRILHVVQKARPFLRRNPRQTKEGPDCRLCESYSVSGNSGSVILEDSGIGLILATRRYTPVTTTKKPHPGPSSRPSRIQKYATAFGVLYKIMEQAGFTSLSGPLIWDEIWRRIQQQLRAVALHPDSAHSLADFIWSPGRLYSGGLAGLNHRMLQDWEHPTMSPEGWVFSTLPDRPVDGDINLYTLSASDRAILRANDQKVYGHFNFKVDENNIARNGGTGPYLMMAVGTANFNDKPPYAKPIFHRLILQAILSEKCPIPVESRFEREVAVLLMRRRIAFHKPVFCSEGLRPDFVLPEAKVIIEVQGMNTDDYPKHKRAVHERMLMSETYGGFKLVTYDANDGEEFNDFEGKLMRLVR